MDLADLRREYSQMPLLESQVDPDPIKQFDIWFKQALEVGLKDPNAMTLATSTTDGIPSARIVLLKHFDERGFCFYTNYRSRKSLDLDANPHASLVSYWSDLDRQVRINGEVKRTDPSESERYFRDRPRGSQLSAWASDQYQVFENREQLDHYFERVAEQYDGKDVPLPPYWGGFRLVPQLIEFWHGRKNRLHDRLRYSKQTDDNWIIERLAP